MTEYEYTKPVDPDRLEAEIIESGIAGLARVDVVNDITVVVAFEDPLSVEHVELLDDVIRNHVCIWIPQEAHT